MLFAKQHMGHRASNHSHGFQRERQVSFVLYWCGCWCATGSFAPVMCCTCCCAHLFYRLQHGECFGYAMVATSGLLLFVKGSIVLHMWCCYFVSQTFKNQAGHDCLQECEQALWVKDSGLCYLDSFVHGLSTHMMPLSPSALLLAVPLQVVPTGPWVNVVAASV